MASYHITGGKVLGGTVKVGGSKNATLPIICATLLTAEKCVLKNVPNISDVHNLAAILRGLGSKVEFEGDVLTIDNSGVNSYAPDPALVKKLRGSILLVGPLLGRFKKVEIAVPGGDAIGRRPITSHTLAFEEFGAKITEDDLLRIDGENIHGAKVILNEMSVTATENAVMVAVLAKGQSSIHLAATEPHVQDLCRMLVKMGAKISGIGTHDLVIEGVDELHGVEHSIIFDNEVACSYINLAASTRSEILIDNIQPDYLNSALIQFRMMNVNYKVTENSIQILKPEGPYKAAKIKAATFPGLLSDYIPPFAVLATQAEGTSIVHEWMYEGRLGYIHELSKMGAKATILDQHRAQIEGPTKLHGTNVSSLDVRGGMVMIIAALVAEGTSVLHDVEHVERGYPNIAEVIRSLGGDIQRQE
jgi:UDP-N-acetylglucosamine 1-carboxyvinyltransferase